MTVSANAERLGYGSTDGCVAEGLHTSGVVSVGSAKTLTVADSGKTFLLDTATGSVVTLPTPAEGIKYKFIVSVSVTSNNHIIGGSAGEFLLGSINMLIDTSGTSEGQVLDGATHLTLTMNGSTTGGLQGTVLEFEGLNATQWGVSGLVVGSGTLATPATT
jgi:hypothetical protein